VKSGRAARARSESRQRFKPVHFRTRKQRQPTVACMTNSPPARRA